MSVTLYDDVAYPAWPYRQTNPLKVSAVAALLGLPYAEVATARVLEIGCGDAASLIPMAMSSPDAQFVGFDLSEVAIARGQAQAQALGLTNLRLEALDILQAEGLGRFDYIIAHGVYSWVPPVVRDGLMRVVREHLSPDGLAFVSYNALPGCRIRQALRDLLIFHLGGLPTGPEVLDRVREILRTFIEGALGPDPLLASMRLQAKLLLERDPAVIFHDELSEYWQPFYLHEFAAHAGAHGLELLGDVEGMGLRQDLFPTPLGAALHGFAAGDNVRFQQYQGFFSARIFYQSLLRHAGGAPASFRFEPERVRKLYAGAPAKVEPPAEGDAPGETRFRFGADSMIKIAEPELKAALQRLSEAWPQFVPIAELQGADTPEALAQLFTAGHVDLHTGPWPGMGGVAERPVASPLARRQVARGLPYVTTLDLCTIKLEDPLGRAFLGLLDGTRDHAALATDVAALAGKTAEEAAPMVEPHLRQLAGMGLLMG